MAKRKERRHNLIIPLLIILCMMVAMQLYTSRLINSIAVANIREIGADKLASVAAKLNNYLDKTQSALWVTADTVDYMVRNGSTAAQIEDYIVEETQNQSAQFDENYTGFYGYINGEYVDGLRWQPPEGYDPLKRDWYGMAVEAGGESTIVPPYIDAQTNDVVISICRQLSDKRNVMALDVTMNRIQDIVEELKIKEKGYGFIVDPTGMIIAHQDESRKGSYLTQTEEDQAFMALVNRTETGNFETKLNGRQCTVFVNRIINQWYLVIAISNAELYAEVWQQMVVNVLICFVIFVLIAFFYYYGYRNEQNYARRMEEMKMEEQQQAYETRMLKLAKEAADQSNKAKSDFLAEMSHEIRTPINAVLGMNEMIMRESGAALEAGAAQPARASFADISRYAANIESAGNNLLSIINDILDFSKIEAGKLEIVPADYKLSSVLNDLSNMVVFRARSKGLEFRVDVDGSLPDGLYGDELRVRQVITNLLSNAVKYTEAGSVLLGVRGGQERRTDAGDVIDLVISVQDTGIGIRKEDLDKLFDKFIRVDLTRNSTIEGTGLGLAITRRLLLLMDGSVEVSSVYGQGSTFTVTIPQRIVSREPVGNFRERFEKSIHESRARVESFHAPDARILIVDDTRMNLAVVTGLLKHTRVKADTADSGAEAIRLAEGTVYDLILMDQRMPEMDGTQAMRRIRERGANRQTPVICVTADAVSGAREKYMRAGFTDYLTKPIDGQALEKVLIRYLPAEKVTLVQPDRPPVEGAAAGAADLATLRAAGINPDEGLAHCQGDMAFYRSLLLEYEHAATERAQALEAHFAARDWKNYGIQVHALKSTSGTIGAAALAEAAQRLEVAASEGAEAVIQRDHGAVLDRYRATVEAIRRVSAGQTEWVAAADSDIIEFMPEEE